MLTTWEQIHISVLENVEQCGGEPERADTGIFNMSLMSDVTSSKLVFSAS